MRPSESEASPTPDRGRHPRLAASFSERIPEADGRARRSCDHCEHIAYENPKVVVGSVPVEPASGRILLCRRAIEPARGAWTIPAGYLEIGESLQEGARREAREEAGAELRIERWLGVQALEELGQVMCFFASTILNPEALVPGPESQELALFAPQDIPRDELAFSSVHWALALHAQEREGPALSPPL